MPRRLWETPRAGTRALARLYLGEGGTEQRGREDALAFTGLHHLGRESGTFTEPFEQIEKNALNAQTNTVHRLATQLRLLETGNAGVWRAVSNVVTPANQ